MQIRIYVTLVWFTAILIGGLGLVVYLGGQKLSSKKFAQSLFFVTIWATIVGGFSASNTESTALIFCRLSYLFGIFSSATFLLFALTYPYDKKPAYHISNIVIFICIVFSYLLIYSDLVISDVFKIASSHPWGWHFNTYSPLFEIFFFSFFILSISILIRKLRKESEVVKRSNIKYMLWGVILGATPPSLICIILPRLGYFGMDWLGPVTELAWIPVIAYSIIKYRQMDVKIVITEVLAIAMSAIFFINIFIDIPFGLVGRISAFLGFLVIGYFMIKSVITEAKQREQLKVLNLTLEQKVSEQTAEIRGALERERHTRLELEKLNDAKNSFISIVEHNIRGPLTNLEHAIGSIKNAPVLKNPLETMRRSTERIQKLTEEFQNIRTLKPGANILNLTETSLLSTIEEILADIHEDISKLKLTVAYPKDPKQWPPLHVDLCKMHECLFVILENAVKYNRLGGSINISAANTGTDFVLTIENTGIGITPNEIEKLSTSKFYRGESAREHNPIGMGVGLSLARVIIRAHKGELEINSAGVQMGARVTVKLPLIGTPKAS